MELELVVNLVKVTVNFRLVRNLKFDFFLVNNNIVSLKKVIFYSILFVLFYKIYS